MNTERFRLIAFPFPRVRRFAAEIDDRGDTKFFQLVRCEICGRAPRKSEPETFPALEIPGRKIFSARESEEDATLEEDCRNGTAGEKKEE